MQWKKRKFSHGRSNRPRPDRSGDHFSHFSGGVTGVNLMHEDRSKMMNVSMDTANKVVDSLRGTPFVMVIVIINTIALLGFAYSMHEISKAADRRDGLLEKCIVSMK